MSIGISSFLSPSAVVLDLRATDKTSLLHELSRRAAGIARLPPETVFAELDKRLTFIECGVNLLGQACSENLVLLLQVFDVLGQFAVGRRRDQSQQRMEQLDSHGMLLKGVNLK